MILPTQSLHCLLEHLQDDELVGLEVVPAPRQLAHEALGAARVVGRLHALEVVAGHQGALGRGGAGRGGQQGEIRYVRRS